MASTGAIPPGLTARAGNTQYPISTPPRVAIVHDWLNQIGGAENVLETLVRMFPTAPVFTSIYAPERMPPEYCAWDIRTTFMQHLPGVAAHHQVYLPLYPLAFSRVDLAGYDLILSNKSAFCHGVPVPPGATHICYCLTPTRFLWQYGAYRAREELNPALDVVLRPAVALLRRWDYAAAQRVHHLIAISTEIQARIRRFYNRESTIIYPPADIARFRPSGEPPGDYFLAGGRLIPYKRTDLAVRACSELGLRLLVYGDGRDRPALEKLAGPSVTFLGRVAWDELAQLYAGARAFIFPGLEDFGIAPVEAQAAGRPVIAFADGGALDTVIPGRTGEFFTKQTVESLKATLERFDPSAYDPATCRANAERFSTERFEHELSALVTRVV
jgi:glycosyltransferase involved in cell wall biosynthesis